MVMIQQKHMLVICFIESIWLVSFVIIYVFKLESIGWN